MFHEISSKWLRITSAILISLVVIAAIAVSAPAQAQANEIIVDNADTNTSRIGRWWVSSGEDPYGPDSLYNPDDTSRFFWYPELPEPGVYYVYAYWTRWSTRSTEVPFYIVHANGTAKVTVDMRNEYFASRWNLLGRYEFSDAGPHEISVSGENGQASADAIKLVPADEWQPGHILGYYSAPAVYDVVPQGNSGGVLSKCAPGDYVVSASYGVQPQTIHEDTSKFYFRITSFHIVIDGTTGDQSWALTGKNESSIPLDAKIFVSARCADVAD